MHAIFSISGLLPAVILNLLCYYTDALQSSILDSTGRYLNHGKIDGGPVTATIDKFAEYTYLYTATEPGKAVRISTEVSLTDHVTPDFPIIFQVRQRQLSQSWVLPVKSNPARIYTRASRTLCSTLQHTNATSATAFNLITLTVSTLSSVSISFSVVVQYEHEFVLELNGNPVAVEVSPLSPRLLRFIFPPKLVSKGETVFVQVWSKDLGCMTVSIQDPMCPFHDQEENIQHDGYWQTMNTTSAVTVQRDLFPTGFFIVLVMHHNGSICDHEEHKQIWSDKISSHWQESKMVKVTVKDTVSKDIYLVAQAVPLLFIILVYGASLICYLICKNDRLPEFHKREEESTMAVPPNNNQEDVERSLSQCEQNLRSESPKLCLDVFTTKNEAEIEKRSRIYLHIVFIVAILYFLPAVQLASLYQRTVHKTGNQDMCYFNFHCARPVGKLNDYNHVYSNAGYILLGLLAVINVCWWERLHPQVLGYGIPNHYGILYALAWTIVCEGLLSGVYHVCPNRSNFHHDTSFMFIAVLLTTLKLYQARHPDTNASANTAFLSLVFIIFSNLVAEVVDHFWFWMGFTLFYILCSLIMAAQLFYSGRLKLDSKLLWKVLITLKNDNEADADKLRTPRSLHVLICIGLFINIGFAVCGGILRPPSFGFILLIVFTVNMILYLAYYVIMKIINKEVISRVSRTLLLSAASLWAIGVYFFVQLKTNWEHSPAVSRTLNEDCFILGFYDPHDLWHFLSAFGLFFTLMGLLTLDDELRTTARSEIAVF